MKQTDLRIGNYIRYRDEWDCEIQSLGSSFETHNKDLNNYLYGIRCGSDDIEDYNPILLTEDWLLKLGFEVVNENLFVKYNIALRRNGGSMFFNIYYHSFRPSELAGCMSSAYHVHEVQNIYFAISNEELELIPCNQHKHYISLRLKQNEI